MIMLYVYKSLFCLEFDSMIKIDRYIYIQYLNMYQTYILYTQMNLRVYLNKIRQSI